MGNLISYEIIIPIEWYVIHPTTLWDLVMMELGSLILGGEEFNESIITINGTATLLTISHEELSWWFKIPGDQEPSPQRYVFSGDLLVEMYPGLYDEYVVKQQLHVLNYPSKDPELRYSAIVPNEWLQWGTETDVSNIIFQDLNRRMMRDQPIDGAEITIHGITATLFISNQCLTWCFVKNGDNGINDREYTRVNNWINALFRRMVNFHTRRHQLVAAINNININPTVEDEGFFDEFINEE